MTGHDSDAARPEPLGLDAAGPGPATAPIAIVVNPSAGSADDDDLEARLRDAFGEAEIVRVGDDDLIDLLRRAARAPVMGVVGGDGTVNAAVGVALETGTPLAVVPGGTLNHFARDLGLETIEDTAEAVAAGRIERIDVGRIANRPFVNTASFGSYADLVDERERLEDRIGKWPAAVVAGVRVLRRAEPTEVSIDGRRTRVWAFFAGNCAYEPPGLAPLRRNDLGDGVVDVRWIDASVPLARTRTVGALLAGPWGSARAVRTLRTSRVEITSHDGPLRLARDGETFDGGRRVVIDKYPERLAVFVGRRSD